MSPDNRRKTSASVANAAEGIRRVDQKIEKRQKNYDQIDEAFESFSNELKAFEDESRKIQYPKPEEKKPMSNDKTDELEQVKMTRKKKKKKKPILRWIILLIVLALISILGAAVWYYFDCQKAVQKEEEAVVFTVNPGDTVQTVTENLEAAGLIKDAKMAYYFVRLNHFSDIVAGDFSLDKSWDVKRIFAYLNDQNAVIQDDVRFTIIEGDWAKHAANSIAAVTELKAEDLIALWNNEEWIRSIMPDYPFLTEEIFDNDIRIKLEGYLTPDTYEVKKDCTAEEATLKILDETLNIYNQYAEAIANNPEGFSIHEVYTLASIIQYEAGTNKETQELVSSVFINRLAWDYPMQSSVTVCYAIDYDRNTDNWQACEVNTEFNSPYNTYKYTGLPPGPIENPGIDAIDSVVHAPETNYFFFMADVCGDGTVYFAETENEHYANVAKYLTCY